MLNRAFWTLLLFCGFALPSVTQNASTFVNFETALTSPIRLSPDGTRLFSVNNPNATVSVFDVGTNPAVPALITEIPVGIDPVSVNPRSDDEVWVVNEESDSVSVVSVSQGIVTDTLQAKDEPSDVVFAGNYAFVSATRTNTILVFDVNTHVLVQSIPVFGGLPRQMTVSPDGSTVYAAFALSGNATTLVPQSLAPPPPPPVNQALPPAPQQGIIVEYNDPAWTSVIKYTMPDNDVVAINTSTLSVIQYFSGVGTVNLGLAVRPFTGDLFVANTDALNLVRFQTALDDHFENNRISKITPTGTVTAYDLNPTVTYTGVPDPNSLAVALAQPAGVVFDSSENLYIAAFGTDRVAKVDTQGNVLNRIEINPSAKGSVVNPTNKRGPRGLAINNSTNTLYVMNRISNTISVVNTTSNKVTSEIKTGSKDPTPNAVRAGRGFLYDAKLSGNGTGSCASCHVDGEGDHLSWDFGRPYGLHVPGDPEHGRHLPGASHEGADEYPDAARSGVASPLSLAWRQGGVLEFQRGLPTSNGGESDIERQYDVVHQFHQHGDFHAESLSEPGSVLSDQPSGWECGQRPDRFLHHGSQRHLHYLQYLPCNLGFRVGSATPYSGQ